MNTFCFPPQLRPLYLLDSARLETESNSKQACQARRYRGICDHKDDKHILTISSIDPYNLWYFESQQVFLQKFIIFGFLSMPPEVSLETVLFLSLIFAKNVPFYHQMVPSLVKCRWKRSQKGLQQTRVRTVGSQYWIFIKDNYVPILVENGKETWNRFIFISNSNISGNIWNFFCKKISVLKFSFWGHTFLEIPLLGSVLEVIIRPCYRFSYGDRLAFRTQKRQNRLVRFWRGFNYNPHR